MATAMRRIKSQHPCMEHTSLLIYLFFASGNSYRKQGLHPFLLQRSPDNLYLSVFIIRFLQRAYAFCLYTEQIFMEAELWPFDRPSFWGNPLIFLYAAEKEEKVQSVNIL